MEARINSYGNAFAGKFAKALNSAGAVVTGSTLSATTQELVKIRASQINGCSGCTDMHTKDAQHAGESAVRLNLVAAWRDATVFTEAEKAALELTEQGTRLADLYRTGRPGIIARDSAGTLWYYPNTGGTGLRTFGARIHVGAGWTGYAIN